MTNLFSDIEKFHTACGQEVNEENYKLYIDLIEEEFNVEFKKAFAENDRTEQLDALIDTLVVTIGAIRAGGFDGEGAWQEVMRTNFAKIDTETGKVRKRSDGKILKPEGWEPPNLAPYLGKQ